MTEERTQCLWHATDGRCSSCKSKRIRLDVLKIPDYEMCIKERDYSTCEFFIEKPKISEKK
jgi:hypothetical protein